MADSTVFSPGRIGNLELKNRFVRSATYENAATNYGEVTDELVHMYRTLGQGGTGLIITGIAAVLSEYHFPHRAMLIDDDRFIPGLSRISQAVHDLNNGCKIMVQLHLPGRQVIAPDEKPALVNYLPPALLTLSMPKGQGPVAAETPAAAPSHVVLPTAPSAIRDTMFNRVPRALTVEEIEKIVEAFAQGALRAKSAGFDGVQLHAAHGWLLSSFLSPHTNKREDHYGGSTENRIRIVKEIHDRSRKLVGKEFPILIKINTTDFFPDGTDTDETLRVCQLLETNGFDAIEVSGGMWESVTRSREDIGFAPYFLPEARTGINRKDLEAYFFPAASEIRKAVRLPIILVGGLKSLDRIEEVLASQNVDFIAMSRALLRQPDLPNLWQSGKGPQTAACISCNACVVGGETITSCKQV